MMVWSGWMSVVSPQIQMILRRSGRMCLMSVTPLLPRYTSLVTWVLNQVQMIRTKNCDRSHIIVHSYRGGELW